MWSDLTLHPPQGQTRIAKLKSAYNSIIKMLFIFKTMLFVLLRLIHLASVSALSHHQTQSDISVTIEL